MHQRRIDLPNGRLVSALSLAAALLWSAASALGQPRAKDGEWPSYNADLAGSRYRPLDHINASNFNKLEIAWRFKTHSIGHRPQCQLAAPPLMVNAPSY